MHPVPRTISFLLLACCLLVYDQVWCQNGHLGYAQEPPEAWAASERYRPSRPRVADILHMKLEVEPHFAEKELSGRSRMLVTPYNRPIREVVFDAKGMDIHGVEWQLEGQVPVPLEYSYDSLRIRLPLPETVSRGDTFTLDISYRAFPYELEERGISLNSGRGLYFIDPEDHNPSKPVQLWTQGQTISNSAWFPTVDAPNEQFTHEIHITVPSSYSTLSNGLLIDSTFLDDGRRTDHWAMRLPHSAYLVMMAAGEFHVERDSWQDIELSYYTAPEFGHSVDDVFGSTPEMLTFFSDIFGVPFPWESYAQMVVYDYISGAMENTTAVLYYDAYFADSVDLIDYPYDNTIAHELCHQWFGDLVTCESWAHLTLNEAFATYGEYLWNEHRYGRDAAEHERRAQMDNYLREALYKVEPVVNYYYSSPDDLFDAHRYDKGSCVLHMLRTYLGDEVFFAALQQYLSEHRFGTTEIHDLRLAFEAESGEDLYWFFDQWFLMRGHPMVQITQEYLPKQDTLILEITQVQGANGYPIYRMPLAIDLYFADTVIRHRVWAEDRTSRFSFPAKQQPLLVNTDAEKAMLWMKTDNKPLAQYMYQYLHGPLYADRREALDELQYFQDRREVAEVFAAALQDPSWGLRRFVLNSLDPSYYSRSEKSLARLEKIASGDTSTAVRRAALEALADIDPQRAYNTAEQVFQTDGSRMVRAVALDILHERNPELALDLARTQMAYGNFYLQRTIMPILAERGAAEDHHYFLRILRETRYHYLADAVDHYTTYLQRMDSDVHTAAAAVLADLALFEETTRTRELARQALETMAGHYEAGSAPGDELKAGIFRTALDKVTG